MSTRMSAGGNYQRQGGTTTNNPANTTNLNPQMEQITAAVTQAIRRSLSGAGASSIPNPPLFETLLSANSQRKRNRQSPSFYIKKRKPDNNSKFKSYIRDVLCIPKSWSKDPGHITIPRGDRRSFLANLGLIGKLEFNSEMTEDDIQLEFCHVFGPIFGLPEQDLENGKRLKLKILQKTGPGSRTLHTPTVSTSFKWNGKNLASIKAGAMIYIQVEDEIPGIKFPDAENDKDMKEEMFGEGRTEDEGIEEEKEDDAEKSSDVIVIEGEEDIINHNAPSSGRQTTNNPLAPSSSGHDNDLSQPSSSHHQLPFCTDVASDMDKLISIFPNLSAHQIKAIYNASHSNFSGSVDCILQGPTTEGICGLLHEDNQKAVTNLAIDPSEIWHDMVAFYKLNSQASTLCPRIRLRGSIGIDIGGIRKQMFTTTYMEFAENKHIKLFEGEINNLRPVNGSFARHSGLFKVLGTMIAHSIALDGIGFPYFSKFCYRYIAEGEEKALEAINLNDIGHNVKAFIEKLNEAVTNADLQFSKVEEQINALDLMSNAGVEEQLSMMNKDLVAQAVIHTETIHKCGKQLDEIKDGLGSTMELIQAFPELFEEFFVAKPITGDDIIDALYTTTRLDDNQKIVMEHLEKYAKSLSLKGAQDFLQFVTGTVYARRRSILVNFDDGDEGAIAALTCGSTIVLPTRPFKDDEGSYQLFAQALQAVIPITKFRLAYYIN